MRNFTKSIAVKQDFTPEFSFNCIHTVNGIHYYVYEKDKYGQTLAFNMEERNSEWKIVDAPKVPDWVINIEGQLGRAILENLHDQ
jgi:hypothetical protein